MKLLEINKYWSKVKLNYKFEPIMGHVSIVQSPSHMTNNKENFSVVNKYHL